jgi:D-glycero-alpha-D-manno-heptose-7-phosphate kinase
MAEQYELAIAAGALGGKLCGAGGGGGWVFLVPKNKRDSVIQTLGLAEIPFQVDRKGLQEWYL